MQTLLDSPAKIVRQLLVDLGQCGEPSFNAANSRYSGANWPAFFSSEPDQPDNAVWAITTPGVSQGESMIDGEPFGFEGVQITVRAKDHDTGWAKATAIRTAIAGVSNKFVNVGGNRYTFGCFASVGDVLYIGTGPDSKRHYFTINAITSIDVIGS